MQRAIIVILAMSGSFFLLMLLSQLVPYLAHSLFFVFSFGISLRFLITSGIGILAYKGTK